MQYHAELTKETIQQFDAIVAQAAELFLEADLDTLEFHIVDRLIGEGKDYHIAPGKRIAAEYMRDEHRINFKATLFEKRRKYSPTGRRQTQMPGLLWHVLTHVGANAIDGPGNEPPVGATQYLEPSWIVALCRVLQHLRPELGFRLDGLFLYAYSDPQRSSDELAMLPTDPPQGMIERMRKLGYLFPLQ